MPFPRGIIFNQVSAQGLICLGSKITLEILHSCGGQNTDDFPFVSAKNENMESLKLYQELKDSTDRLALFLQKKARFCMCLKCLRFGLVQMLGGIVPYKGQTFH